MPRPGEAAWSFNGLWRGGCNSIPIDIPKNPPRGNFLCGHLYTKGTSDVVLGLSFCYQHSCHCKCISLQQLLQALARSHCQRVAACARIGRRPLLTSGIWSCVAYFHGTHRFTYVGRTVFFGHLSKICCACAHSKPFRTTSRRWRSEIPSEWSYRTWGEPVWVSQRNPLKVAFSSGDASLGGSNSHRV